MAIAKGELRAVVGPNGAGKTTMLDIITGKTRPDQGRVVWDEDTDLTRLDEADTRAARDRAQVPEADGLRDAERRGEPDAGAGRQARGGGDAVPQADRAARRGGSASSSTWSGWPRCATRLAGSLSHGQKQWLEIGMLLAQEPQLLLVDEPAAGMTDAETMRTAELLRSIAGERSVVVIEHDMEFVRALDCKVTVLHRGAVLAEGSLDHVSANPEVIEVYLGR